MGKEEPPLKRLLDKTAFNVKTGCWEWTASVRPNGYGQFNLVGVTRYAHRAAYTLLAGPIPNGFHLDHLCRVRHCVNPDHLEPVTQQENIRRGVEVRTTCRKGHLYNEANTLRHANGARFCGECKRQRSRATYASRKLEAA